MMSTQIAATENRNFRKVMRVGTMKTYGGRRASIYIEAKMTDGKFSMTGVVGPLPSGNAIGGCGQIDMEFAHRNPKDNDSRYDHPIDWAEITYAAGWTADKWLDLLDIWKKWHLNDMHSECEHQEALGWTYDTHKGQKCPTCGYEIGTSWTKRMVPDAVIAQVMAFPDADRAPAWV